MKLFFKAILVVIFSLIAHSGFSSNTGDFSKPTPKANDSTTVSTSTSNIVIFKMIPTPAYTNTGGSLKKAGKVARTSNSRS